MMSQYRLIAFALLAAVVFGIPAYAAPETIPIRGQLVDADGFALTGERSYSVQFFDAETEGTALGGELTGTATLSAEGVFVLSVTPPVEVLSRSSVWYAIAVDSDAVPNGIDTDDLFVERVKVESVPFSLRAAEAMHVDAAAIADGSVSDAELQALDGVTGSLQTQLDAKLESMDIDATTAATATNASDIATTIDAVNQNGSEIATNTSAIATKADSADVLPRVGEAHVLVTVTSSATTNGTNLLAAYTDATALTPHGGALSVTNRAVVLVPPGNYDLGTSQLTLDTEFVDLVGLTTARENQYIFGTTNGPGTGVLAQSADDVRIENLFIECTLASGGDPLDSSRQAAYFPDGNKPNTIVRNCMFRADVSNALPMRFGVEYAGTYENCAAGDISFGSQGDASGTFTNCTGGDFSFGANGTASGTFTNCTAGAASFGSDGTASGTFTDCTGGLASFGTSGTASGTFANCTGGDLSFGASGLAPGTASGTFTNCIGGDVSFGTSGTLSGTFTNCTAGTSSFGSTGDASGGSFFFCSGDAGSFTTTGSPTVVSCVRNGEAYPPPMNEAHVEVTVTSSAASNGTNLLAAYTAATALTPHGAALSATNRAVVIVPPGNYDLGIEQLTLDTEFVDLVGLTTARDSQYIFGTANGPGTGVLAQSADDVRIENLFIECTLASGSATPDASRQAAYFPDGNKPNTIVRNCTFKADGSNVLSMRFEVEYAGTYENCTAGDFSFGLIGTASGTFTNCTAGQSSFGSGGFGIAGTASGTFTNCTAGPFSFGLNGDASGGTFYFCTSGASSFTTTGSPTVLYCVMDGVAYP